MKVQRLSVFLTLLCVTSVVRGMDECAPQNTDPGELAEMNIFHTVTLEKDGISLDEVEKQVNSSRSREMEEINKNQMELQQASEAGEVKLDAELAPSTADSRAASLAATELAYFIPVCPYRYYWLSNYIWYFYVSWQRKYCWAYYPIYATSCTTRYCNYWYKNPYVFYFYYRCFPNYRSIWMWARCATLSDNNQWVWSSEYVHRYVPRGCSCRKYFNPFLVAKTCPAGPTIP